MGFAPESRFRIHGASASIRLNSWKEIAAYLDRDPRTVQLWEKAEGLPVHRLTHQARASVYAYTDEVDAWLQERSNYSESTRAGNGLTVAVEVKAIEPPAFVQPRTRLLWRAIIAIAIFVAAAVAIAGWIVYRRSGVAGSAPPVLAVLPFQNQTSTDNSLVDGITDGLISDLGRINKFKVIASRSVASFKGRQVGLKQIRDELHASLALEGTVAEFGNQTQVTVELIDAVHEKHIWGATYHRQAGDILALQDEITSQIANDVARKITGSASGIKLPAAAIDPRARQAYLQGRFYWNQRDLADLQKAIASFGQAIAIDPKYAPAYSGLAESYDLMTDRGMISNDEAFRRARAASTMALSLDPNSAEAYNALAFAVYRQDWDFAGAEKDFQKSIQLNPNYAVAHQWYGEFLGDLQRFDASIAELKKARELDPLSPMVGCDLADGYLHAGRLTEADAELNRVLELYPDFISAHSYRLALLLTEQKWDEAQSEASLIAGKTGDNSTLDAVAIRRFAAQGNVAAARAVLNRELANPGGAATLSAYSTAQLDFFTGQSDAGYENLEKAYRDHSWWLVTMLVDPGLESVRNKPRFLDIARRVGLPLANATQAHR